MITRHSHTTVYVLDQDSAHRFYTEKLGLEVRDDVRMGTFRWLTVAPKTQPDSCLVLMPIGAGPMMDEATAAELRAMVKKGVFGVGVLECDDCRRTYEELKARGVEFLREPKEMPYGIEARRLAPLRAQRLDDLAEPRVAPMLRVVAPALLARVALPRRLERGVGRDDRQDPAPLDHR
jgi:catechol 2,3-dioxygenase-like lactoylglutathione lyase family enzyme